MQVLGRQRVGAGAVIGVDGYSVVLSHLNNGVNICDAEMNGYVRKAVAGYLALREAFGVDGYLVAVTRDAMQGKGTVLAGGCFLGGSRLQVDLGSDDGSSRGVEHRPGERLCVSTGLCVEVSANAQHHAEEHESPTIHRSTSTSS